MVERMLCSARTKQLQGLGWGRSVRVQKRLAKRTACLLIEPAHKAAFQGFVAMKSEFPQKPLRLGVHKLPSLCSGSWCRQFFCAPLISRRRGYFLDRDTSSKRWEPPFAVDDVFQAGGNQHQRGFPVGERADDAGTPPDLPVEPLDGVVRADAPPMLAGYLAVRQRLGEALAHDLGGLFQLHRLELGGHRLGLGRRGLARFHGVDGLEHGRDPGALGFGNLGQRVAVEAVDEDVRVFAGQRAASPFVHGLERLVVEVGDRAGGDAGAPQDLADILDTPRRHAARCISMMASSTEVSRLLQRSMTAVANLVPLSLGILSVIWPDVVVKPRS